MGRHRGSGDGKAGTDAGPAFGDLTPEQKGAEFDASTADAPGYAARNFGSATMPNVSGTGARHDEYMSDPAAYGDE
jgi:hypothetical protein